MRCFTSSVARAIFSADGCRVLPKLLNDSMAIARLDVEALHLLRRQDGDIRKLLGGRIEVDRRVGDEPDIVLEDQHVQTGDRARCPARALMICSAGRMVSRIVFGQTGHQPVRIAGRAPSSSRS